MRRADRMLINTLQPKLIVDMKLDRLSTSYSGVHATCSKMLGLSRDSETPVLFAEMVTGWTSGRHRRR